VLNLFRDAFTFMNYDRRSVQYFICLHFFCSAVTLWV